MLQTRSLSWRISRSSPFIRTPSGSAQDPLATIWLSDNLRHREPQHGGEVQLGIANNGVYVGEGLPLVPSKLAKRIRAREFIDIGELLPEVLMPKEEGKRDAKRKCGKRLTDIFMWLQCFGVYASIWGEQSLGSTPELMAYMSIIIRVSWEYVGTAWQNYDVLF